MGKLRLLDKFSKTFFLIPINLRGDEDRGTSWSFVFSSMVHQTCLIGFPPADKNVRNFLTGKTKDNQGLDPAAVVHHFLVALFEQVAKVLPRMGPTVSEQITHFRDFMSKDQSMASVGNNREHFYNEVVKQAKEVRRRFFTPSLSRTHWF
jgi:hypothetical protein